MIREYDFTSFTDKDFFGMRLAGIQPDFGYITCTKRAPFVAFCIKFGFIEQRVMPENPLTKTKLYDALISFRYSAMFRYEPRPVVMDVGSLAMVGPDFKMGHSG